jgi:hypothetical protein
MGPPFGDAYPSVQLIPSQKSENLGLGRTVIRTVAVISGGPSLAPALASQGRAGQGRAGQVSIKVSVCLITAQCFGILPHSIGDHSLNYSRAGEF